MPPLVALKPPQGANISRLHVPMWRACGISFSINSGTYPKKMDSVSIFSFSLLRIYALVDINQITERQTPGRAGAKPLSSLTIE
jgi:hypothetical protein